MLMGAHGHVGSCEVARPATHHGHQGREQKESWPERAREGEREITTETWTQRQTEIESELTGGRQMDRESRQRDRQGAADSSAACSILISKFVIVF